MKDFAILVLFPKSEFILQLYAIKLISCKKKDIYFLKDQFKETE